MKKLTVRAARNYYCPYCRTKLPVAVRKALPIETELTGQLETTCVKECPMGCMHREAKRKGLISSSK